MNKLFWFFVALMPLASCEQLMQQTKTGESTTDFKSITVNYPNTARDTTVTDDYHGKTVADPYRWLEDDHAPATQDWVKAENQVTFGYLDQIPYRSAIKERLEKLWNYEKIGSPFHEGGRYYYFKNDGLQNQSVLYAQNELGGTSELVLDPNIWSADGTTALGGMSFSKDGKLLAFQQSKGGSDWRTILVMDLSSKQILKDTVNWVKFSGMSWYKDGFFYSRYPEPKKEEALTRKNEFHQVYYHKIGTPQSADELVYADRGAPKLNFYAGTTEDEKFLVVSASESTSGNALFFRDLNKSGKELVPVTESFEFDFNVVDHVDGHLLVLTNHKAANQRLLRIPVDRPEEGYWDELIPETKDVLSNVDILGGKLVATYIHNAQSLIKIFNLDGSPVADLELPGIGTVGGFSGKAAEDLAFYSFTSFTQPTSIYKLDMKTLQSEVYFAPQMDFDGDQYETKQVWYKSYDGTEVPMFITHKKGLKMDGARPTLLYGYGGFNISLMPSFSVSRTVLLENDGIYAVANIRGGGEFGRDWHLAGTKERKQNVFNDFQAAAEYLIAQQYTSSEKLAIEGGSNGGLLVGACITQRPDLYKVAFPAVGVLDMLRYHQFTIGRAWAYDYGTSEDPDAFDYLMAYSPLHNIQPAKYPATMITTADHDDRVVPAHSFKFAAELQHQQQGDAPVLIRIETNAGHGAGKSTTKQIQEVADKMSFMFYNMKENVQYEYKVLQ